jgi:O-antigen/teichoic acid export membrane protein
MTFRSSHDFARLALANVAEAGAGIALLVLVALFDFYGLCLRIVLASAISATLLFHWRPVRVGPKWDTRHFKHLLAIGAPIFGVGLLFGWWGGVVNSTLVLKFAGVEGMGLYSMVLLTTAAMEIIPAAVSQVVYPRMAEQYGREPSLRRLFSIGRKPTLLTAAVLIPTVAVAWFVIGPVTRLIVPAYAEAIPAMQWSLLLAIVGSFQALNSLFNVARRQGLYMTAILLGMAVYGGSLMLLISDGVYLAAFPQAMLIGRAAYMLVSYFFISRLTKREGMREANG